MCWYCESTWPVVCQTRHGRHFNPTFTLLSLLLAHAYHNEHVCTPPLPKNASAANFCPRLWSLIDSWYLTSSREVPHYEPKWWHIHQHGLLTHKFSHSEDPPPPHSPPLFMAGEWDEEFGLVFWGKTTFPHSIWALDWTQNHRHVEYKHGSFHLGLWPQGGSSNHLMCLKSEWECC